VTLAQGLGPKKGQKAPKEQRQQKFGLQLGNSISLEAYPLTLNTEDRQPFLHLD
jgi:hypothetical protein